MTMIRGRKVTDPVVQGTGTDRDGENIPGLTRAWDNVGKAKSDLRKIEQRLEEVERHPVQLKQTGETSIVDYGLEHNWDPNNTYDVRDEFASGAVVDNYGRSAYLKARTQQTRSTTTRKVSKLADKYVDDARSGDAWPKKSSIKSADNHGKTSNSKQNQPSIQLQEKRYPSDSVRDRGRSSGSRSAVDRRVEFDDNLGHYKNNVELNNGLHNRDNGEIFPTEQSTLTDLRDIRETNINFLNNDLTQEAQLKDYHGNRGHDLRLTHVSVTVPGSSTRHGKPASTSSGAGSRSKVAIASNRGHFLDLIENPDMDGRSLSDCSHSDSETGKGRRFKGDIRKIDPGGLAKIKETIRKQIETSSSPKDSRDDGTGATGGDILTQRHLHDTNEPIQPRSMDIREGTTEKTAKVRKIAAGPAAPSYKGFSEAEVKYRLADNKTVKFQDASRKDKKRQVSNKDRIVDPVTNWLLVEEGEGKSKKLTRVIAPSRKPSKQQPQPKHKEIITTSSWRAGQELILRELGPVKSRKSSKMKDTYGSDLDESPLEDRPDLIGEENPGATTGVGSATAAEIQYHKALSNEARRVYDDLRLSDDEIEHGRTHSLDKERRKKMPTKRKAPKATESEKQKEALVAKQRHYDAEQIRKYMQRQKADRIRRQKEEENRAKEEGEARRKAMEELKNKQKVTVTVPKKEKSSRSRSSMDAAINVQAVSELPRHHPFHTDRVRFMVSDDSENKENIGVVDQEMELSDSSSTITGDEDNDDNSQNLTPRRPKGEKNVPNVKTTVSANDAAKTNKVKSALHSSDNPNVRTVGDFSFNVTGVMSKFSQALQEKLNEEPPSLAGTYTGFNDNRYSGGASDGQVSRADRIQAIKDTAATLQNRLKEEARKIQAQTTTSSRHVDNGASLRPSVRWNDMDTRPERETEFVSRYDRVAAAKDDYTVFKTQLPGSQPQAHRPETDTRKPVGGTTNTDRPGGAGHKAEDIGEESTITETSTFSEITMTDESDNEEMNNRKIGTGLQHRDYHAGSSPLEKQTPLNIPRPSDNPAHTTSTKASSNLWEEPDDCNVFSIYSRRQQDRLIRPGREPMSKKKPAVSVNETDVVPTRASSHAHGPVYQSGLNQSPRLVGQRSEGGTSGRRAESPHSKKEPLRTQSPIDKSKSRQSTLSFENQYNDDEDTLEEESYSHTFETEEKSASRMKSASEKPPPSQKSVPLSSKSTSKPPERMISPDIEMSMSEADATTEDITPRIQGIEPEASEPARLSPNSLERRFYTELHNLESMEMSLKQLSGVDRTRAVSLAQQETVSLAQMLKAKQQGYELQLKDIQLKAKLEASEATKQLEDARKRASDAAINAADMIAKVREKGVTQMQDSTRRFIDTQTEATKATAEAAKLLARQGARPKQTSRTGKRRSDEADHDDSGSVGSADDFSLNESMTEDEREEKSFRLILPSESHRKKKHHNQSDNESVTSEVSTTRMLEHEFHSLFAGREESFDKFTEELVNQFMKEESLRAHHQASLLRLRENALLEKTKAEIQWLEQQKGQIRNKGADEKYPQIVKRQRGLKMKLQEQQAEIRRLREEGKAAAKKRQKQLYQEITKRQQSGQMKSQTPAAKGRLGRPHEVHTEAEVSSIDEASDTEKTRPKTYKSDSEIYTEPRSNAKKSKNDSRNVEKYKKIHLDEKYLTQRQSRLMDRRKNAEELLKWKQMLDAEENQVFKLEKKALKLWDKKDKEKDKEPSTHQSVAKDESETKVTSARINGSTKATDTSIRTQISTAQDSTVISENISTARDESVYTSIKESVKTASDASAKSDIHRRMMNDKSNLKNANRSGSESSIQEDMGSQSSIEESKTDDTMTLSYGNETFEDTATPTATVSAKKTSKSLVSPKSPLDQLKKLNNIPSPRASPRSLFSKSHSKNSESESEDSISHTESQSELSDFEGRIRALNEDLRRRKSEADRLKRERKKKKKELMKNKEETLKKQIEAYDNQIQQLKTELQKEMAHEPTAKPTVRPQIKQPRVSSPKALKKPEVTPPKHRSDTDSSGADSTQVSPVVQSEKDKPKSLSTASTTKVSLDRISEGSGESRDLSERSEVTYKTDRTDITPRDKSRSVQETTESHKTDLQEDKTEEIDEEIISEHSEASDDKSKEIKIDLNTKDEDLYDVTMSHASYTEDFVTEPQHSQLPLSARSQMSETEAKTQPQSARSVTEQISEYISEALPSQSASEAFIKPLDLKASQDNFTKTDQSERDIESDIENSYSQQESSRPSSGRSDRSVLSSQTEHESSESERFPVTKRPMAGLVSSNIADIDDLLGDMPEEDMTPVPSRPETPQETPRDKDSDIEEELPLDTLTDFDIGDRVSVTGPSGQRQTGTLLFKGNVKFASGVWAGVELDRPEGRHNGIEKGVQYFKCRQNHGVIVPGVDLLAAPEETAEETVRESINVRSSVESMGSEDNDLMRLISEADKNVQEFIETPEPSPRSSEQQRKINKEKLADQITDDLLLSVVSENVGTMSNIAGRRLGPPVAPKPQTKPAKPLTNGDISNQMDNLENFLQPYQEGEEEVESNKDRNVNTTTHETVNSLMNEAFNHMMSIRNNRQNLDKDQSRDSGNFTDGVEEDHHEMIKSPEDELQGVIDKEEGTEGLLDTPLRPGSPVPGLQSHMDSHKPIEDSGNFEYDDEFWLPPNKAPPPYPGSENDTQSDIKRVDIKKLSDEVCYAVPHETEEINGIVSNAVDEFWTRRRCGESLNQVEPSERFFSKDESGLDLISSSRRVFKKLLFDLSGEVIRTIYKEENQDSAVGWHKPKRKQNKYYRGASPPTTVDVLKPVVQQAVVDILGLNGAKKSSERTKWGIRKKKDLVDTILVQELREEEPEWVNYDDDELAVKMQLTETLFDSLLTDTVQTMNRIFRKKQIMQQNRTGN